MYRKSIYKETPPNEILKKVNLFENEEISVESYHFNPGQEYGLHCHPKGTQVLFVYQGNGQLLIKNEDEELQTIYIQAGEIIFLEKNKWHQVKNNSSSSLIFAQVTTNNAGIITE